VRGISLPRPFGDQTCIILNRTSRMARRIKPAAMRSGKQMKPRRHPATNKQVLGIAFHLLVCMIICACTNQPTLTANPSPTQAPISRIAALPEDATKRMPAEDRHPPILHADGWFDPVPLGGSINTAGAEDSPFITADGQTFFFFFTPDVRVPVEKQILDGVTGIYLSHLEAGSWGEPQRVHLNDPGKLSLDGCATLQDDVIWFCTAREGYAGLHWFTAEYREGGWTNWEIADFDPSYEVGELHFHGDELYFHSARAGGAGEMDIWMMKDVGGAWDQPENVEAVNTELKEAMPFITPDGDELWFNRWYQGSPAIFRSRRVEGEWGTPELILSQFAGEPTLDPAGNIYFVHHYYENGVMIEADIYIAYRN
jgi:hypothetical protein